MQPATLFGLVTVLAWSTSATAFKLCLRYLDVIQMLFYSTLFAVLFFGIFLAARRRLGGILCLEPREYGLYLGMGLLNPLLYYLMAFQAYDLLPAQIAQPINYTWIITLTLVSVPLLRQRLSPRDMAATLVCYAGVVVVSYRNGPGDAPVSLAGIVLAMSCTLIWAFYWIVNLKSRRDPVIAIFLNFLFSLPFSLGLCLFFSSPWPVPTRGMAGAAWIGMFEFTLPFIAWITALRLAGKTSAIANLIFLTPFVSLVFIRLVLGETLTVQTLGGLCLIVAGILVQKSGQGSGTKQEPPFTAT